MSSTEDRCPRCGQLDVNCGCIPPRNVSGHEEAKKMEQETAKAMQEAEAEADKEEPDAIDSLIDDYRAAHAAKVAEDIEGVTLDPETTEAVQQLIDDAEAEKSAMIQAFVDRVKATYVVYRDSWEQKRQEEGFQVSCRLKDRALALVNRIIPDAPISEVNVPDGQEQVAYICIRMSLYTFMRLTYRKLMRSSGHFDERLEFGSNEIRHEADFGKLIEEMGATIGAMVRDWPIIVAAEVNREGGKVLSPAGTWPGRAVCPSCLSELGWRAKALVHGTFTEWDLLPGGVLRGKPDAERDYSNPYDKELFCPLCNVVVEPGDFLTEILPERQC